MRGKVRDRVVGIEELKTRRRDIGRKVEYFQLKDWEIGEVRLEIELSESTN